MVPTERFRLPATSAHQPLRTFHPRRSPLGPARVTALADMWPRYGFSLHGPDAPPVADGVLDRVTLFGRRAPLVLEIGSGMGEAVLAMAADDPARDYLAVEAHLPGVANLVNALRSGGPPNVRVAHGDALDLVRRLLPERSLDALHIFFPDPWPKTKHHKRRIVAPATVALLRSRLVVGGTLHCATDWAPYAAAMLVTLEHDAGLRNVHDGYAPRPEGRPVTKFERRGVRLGHPIADLVFRRVAPDAG